MLAAGMQRQSIEVKSNGQTATTLISRQLTAHVQGQLAHR